MATLSGMIDIDMEDDTLAANALGSPDSNQENAAPVKKRAPRTKAAGKRFTKVPTKRNSSGSMVSKTKQPAKRKATSKRAPLREEKNHRDEYETEEVDEFVPHAETEEALDEAAEASKSRDKRKAPAKHGAKSSKTHSSRPIVAKEKDGEFEYTPKVSKTSKLPNLKASKREASPEPTRHRKQVPETQAVTDTGASAVQADEPIEEEKPLQANFRRNNSARSNSQRRRNPVSRNRTGSVSDTDRAASDPAVRRRLGDLTRKFENLDLKYRNLREVGIKEAEANFERLKTQSEVRAKAANDLINSLRRELATQKAIASNTSSIQDEIRARDVELSKNRALIDQLSASLAESQNENKALQAKLANSRSTPSLLESTNGTRSRPPNSKTGSAEAAAANAIQVAQLKEDLYSDLTGLIMRGVEIGSESDVYDCLQTGRNGTLHFKLSIAKETEDTYDGTEFQYTPRLDNNRDHDLIDILPEYLTDEITFSRENASMFYLRVVETLTKKRRVLEED